MKKSTPPRTEWLTLRLTKEEYQQLRLLASQTLCPTLSDYGRQLLLREPVHVKWRNQSLDDFVRDMARLRDELNRLGGNFNQSVHRLHTLHNVPDIQQWLLLNEGDKTLLFRHIETISTRINDAYQLWSRVLVSPQVAK
jgi:hypothetical protein